MLEVPTLESLYGGQIFNSIDKTKHLTKTSGLNEIQIHDLCDIGAVLPIRYQANWELIVLFLFVIIIYL